MSEGRNQGEEDDGKGKKQGKYYCLSLDVMKRSKSLPGKEGKEKNKRKKEKKRR